MSLVLFTVSRVGRMLTVLAGLIVVTFFLARATNDPVRIALGPEATQEQYDRLQRVLGLDQPLLTQFWNYLGDIAQGDFGESIWQGVPALQLIVERLPASLLLAVAAMLIAVPLGMTLGVLGGMHPGSWIDRVTIGIAAIALAVPDFWLAILLIIIFSVSLDLFPTGGYGGLAELQYLVLPAVTASLLPAGRLARVVRESVSDEMTKLYVVAARSRGLRTRQILTRHVLKNVSVAASTLAGYDFLLMFTGYIATLEVVFAWPGVGRLAMDATLKQDVVLLSALVVVTGLIVSVGNVVLDTFYALVDRRIRD